MTQEEILNNITLLENEILDYITNTEHYLFNWISNKEVQNFIKAYPEDYEDRVHITVCYASSSPLVRIDFDGHPDDVNCIERYTVLPTFRDTTKARWLEWNGKVKELQISEKERELDYYKEQVNNIENELKELKRK